MNDESGTGMVRKLLSAAAVVAGILVWLGVLIQGGRGQISQEFYILYGFLGGFSVIIGFIAFISDFAVKHLSPDSLIAKMFFIFEKSRLRPGSLLIGIPFAIAILLGFLSYVVVASSGASIFPTPNPYGASLEWDADALATRGPLSSIFNGAVVPGLLEEMAVFFGIQATIFFIFLIIWIVSGRNDDIVGHPFLYWIIALFTVGGWSVIFAWAHGHFGGNNEALAFAFLFEFVVQTINQLTGSFVSWIPHILHNSGVVLHKAFSFVTFAIIPYIPGLMPKNWKWGWRGKW